MENFTNTLICVTKHLENVNVDHRDSGIWAISAQTPKRGIGMEVLNELMDVPKGTTIFLGGEGWRFMGDN